MIRPSSLTIAEKCQLSPVLSARYPETNAAIERGSFVDAEVTRILKGDEVLTADPDAADCLRWIRAHVEVLEVQTAVELFDPDTGELLTRGTPDMVGRDPWERDTLLVVDLKKREQHLAGRLAPPDDNLQVLTYALAHVLRPGSPFKAFRVALLLFGEGHAEALWSGSYTSVQWLPILERIRQITCARETRNDRTDPVGKAGPHCSECYPRVHCPSWALPAHQGPSYLEPFTKPGGLSSPEVAGKGLLAIKAMREMADRAEEILQAHRLRNGPGSVLVGDKVWEPVTMPGRRSASVVELDRAGLSQYVKEGRPYQQWRLVRTK